MTNEVSAYARDLVERIGMDGSVITHDKDRDGREVPADRSDGRPQGRDLARSDGDPGC